MEKLGYTPDRLANGLVLAPLMEQHGPGQFTCPSQTRPDVWHQVDLSQDPPCSCEDSFYHGPACKHALGARMRMGDVELLVAAGQTIQRQQRVLKKAKLLDEGEE